VLRTLGARGLVTMVLFIAILGLGWVYAYRERILEWQ
jgi:NADH:ubiquinone oxidoreductase subunit 3 (subunit A)